MNKMKSKLTLDSLMTVLGAKCHFFHEIQLHFPKIVRLNGTAIHRYQRNLENWR